MTVVTMIFAIRNRMGEPSRCVLPAILANRFVAALPAWHFDEVTVLKSLAAGSRGDLHVKPKTVASARVSAKPCPPGAKHVRPRHHDDQLRSLRHGPPRYQPGALAGFRPGAASCEHR